MSWLGGIRFLRKKGSYESGRYYLNKMCTKIKFSKDTAANIVREAIAARRRGEFFRSEIRYYYCVECKAHHTTSKLWKGD